MFAHLSPIFDKKPAARGKSCGNIRPIEVLMARQNERRRSSRLEALVRSVRPDFAPNPITLGLRHKPRLGNSMQLWNQILLAACVLFCLCLPSVGQTDVNDVHVLPREVEKPK